MTDELNITVNLPSADETAQPQALDIPGIISELMMQGSIQTAGMTFIWAPETAQAAQWQERLHRRQENQDARFESLQRAYFQELEKNKHLKEKVSRQAETLNQQQQAINTHNDRKQALKAEEEKNSKLKATQPARGYSSTSNSVLIWSLFP